MNEHEKESSLRHEEILEALRRSEKTVAALQALAERNARLLLGEANGVTVFPGLAQTVFDIGRKIDGLAERITHLEERNKLRDSEAEWQQRTLKIVVGLLVIMVPAGAKAILDLAALF